MDYRRRLLPPVSALAALEAAAETGGFGRAAESLSLTQGAVSRQIAALEAWLGAPLFERRGRGVALTAAGAAYAAEVSPALDRIRNATARMIGPDHADMTVEIATLPTFGMRWLAPRLPAMMASHPGLTVNFSARLSPFDFADERFDGAIHFGEPLWPRAVAVRLMSEVMVAVGSPALAERIAAGERLESLPLLGLDSRLFAWRRWLNAAGLGATPVAAAPVFDQFMMMTQAAAAGAGVALAPAFLIEPELASGALVQLSPVQLAGSQAYYLVYPPEHLRRPAFRRFHDWIVETAAAWEANQLQA